MTKPKRNTFAWFTLATVVALSLGLTKDEALQQGNCHPCAGPNGEDGWCCEMEIDPSVFCEPEEPEEPACVPTWCGLPVQDCSLPPLTGGMDSCGNSCSKPSPEWPHCMKDGVMVDYDFGE